MMMHRRNTAPRRGLTVVESALVLSVFCLLLFGALEYCRFLYVLHITNNAARDAARYAAVNMDKPTTFDAANHTDASGTVYQSIRNYTNARMGGTDRQLDGYRVAVFAVDPDGRALSPPVVRPKSRIAADSNVYPDPFDPADPNRVPWNQASFTEGVAVTIDGTFTPVLPVLLFMPSTIKVTVTSVAGSEG